MGNHRLKKSERLSVRRQVLRRLVRECKIMRSRVEAILNCEAALAHLTEYDEFGAEYDKLLTADTRMLATAIVSGERELGERVKVWRTLESYIGGATTPHPVGLCLPFLLHSTSARSIRLIKFKLPSRLETREACGLAATRIQTSEGW